MAEPSTVRAPFARHKSRLQNGLRHVSVELPHLHSASIVMYAKVGSRYESLTDNGLSHFLEHMLFRGTERLPDAYRLNHAIEALGGTLYAETGRDYSLYQISLHPETLLDGLRLFGEIFRTPTFSEIDVERRIILEELLEDQDEDGRLVNCDDIARQAVWPAHPLGYRITGPYENVARFQLADVRRHFGRCYGARNMVLTLSGAVSHEAMLPEVEQAFGALPAGEELIPESPPDAQEAARFVYVEDKGPQTHAQLLFRGLPEPDPDYPALLALGRVVDDGMSTRLHRRLCDELGLAYYVSANLEHFFDTGLFEIDANAAHANVPELVKECLALCARLRDEPPSDDELDKARRRYRWDLESAFDDPDAMAGWWGGTELFAGPTSFEEKVARMAAVTPERVRSVAQRIFRPERLTVAAVGTLKPKLRDELGRTVAGFR
jgi:predicted Zn-dependent peptidase